MPIFRYHFRSDSESQGKPDSSASENPFRENPTGATSQDEGANRSDPGEFSSGQIEAESEEAARILLNKRGIYPIELMLAPAPMPALLLEEAEELAQHVAIVAGAELPLGAGLRAAAAEATSKRLRNALVHLAAQLEQGSTLEDALQGTNTPAHLKSLLGAAARSGSLSERLNDLLDHYRETRETWRIVSGSMVYPITILVLSYIILLIGQQILVRPMGKLLGEFGLDYGSTTTAVIWWSNHGSIWLAECALGFAAIAFCVRVIFGKARFRRIICSMPLVGSLWHWSGVAEFARLLGALIQERIALPEALKLTGDGISDPQIAKICKKMAEQVADGVPLSRAIALEGSIPASLGPLLLWGEKHGSLPDACRSAAEMFENRARMRASLIRGIAPPIILLVVMLVLGAMVVSISLPLISLMTGLSG